MDVVELFERGGPLMWALLAASAVGVAFFIERLLSLRRDRVLPTETYYSLLATLEAGERTRAEQICREKDSILCRVTASGLRHRSLGRAAVKEAMEETGQVEVGRLESGVGVLSTVAAISPLMGLLGTVTGMIQVFREFSGPDVEPGIAALASGIWQALITTGAGLTVAIPIFVAYRFIEARIDRYGRELEEASLELLARIVPSVTGTGTATATAAATGSSTASGTATDEAPALEEGPASKVTKPAPAASEA